MTDAHEEYVLTPQLIWQVYRVPIMLGIISLLLIALSITIFIKLHQDQIPITFSSDNPEGTRSGAYADQDEMILVDIEGGVVRPGVYRLPQNSRIDDVLGFAGGFTDQADMEAVARSINRAAKLSDGAKIYVPIKNMTTEDNRPGVEGITMININTASRTELEDIPGIGPVTADKIISARPFTRLEELVERNVLSISLYDKVKNLLTL